MAGKRLASAVAAALLALPAAAQAQAEKVLRVVPHADLRIVDPYGTTATITLMHGQMIYDQLFGWNSKLEPKPQMVEHYGFRRTGSSTPSRCGRVSNSMTARR